MLRARDPQRGGRSAVLICSDDDAHNNCKLKISQQLHREAETRQSTHLLLQVIHCLRYAGHLAHQLLLRFGSLQA